MVRILIFLSFFSFYLFAQDISVKVSTDSSNYLVGDYINFKIETIHKEGITFFLPSIKDSLKGLEYLSQKAAETKKVDDKIQTIFQFVFAGYDSGAYVIPSFLISYTQKGDTNSYFFRTDSLLINVNTVQVDTSAGIKDIKNPELIPFDYKELLLWLAGIIVLGLILFYLYKRFKKKPIKEEIIKIVKKSPWEDAIDSLNELEKKQLWQKGEVKQYHSEITEIIRRYFELRFNFNALEMTTTEVISNLKNNSESNSITEITEAFLNNADMVKFAKFIPMPQVNEEMMQQAREIVQKTIKSNGAENVR